MVVAKTGADGSAIVCDMGNGECSDVPVAEVASWPLKGSIYDLLGQAGKAPCSPTEPS